jgi:hypothetical protein
MPLPNVFATTPTGAQRPGADLDANFNAVGALTVIPCTAVGTNSVVLTPFVNTPTVGAYANYQLFSFVVVNTPTGTLALAVQALASLPVYQPDGITQAGVGGIIAGQYLIVAYVSSLNSGLGGFQIVNMTQPRTSFTGQGKLALISSTQIIFEPFGGSNITVNGATYQIPAAGIFAGNTGVFVNGVAAQNLAINTGYLVTLFNNAGTPTIDFKTTFNHEPSSAAGNVGVEIWNNDNSRSMIGFVFMDGAAHFNDSTALRDLLSWFNRVPKAFVGNNTSGATTASGTFTELTSSARVEFCTWADTTNVFFGVAGTAQNATAGNSCSLSVALDSTGPGGVLASLSGNIGNNGWNLPFGGSGVAPTSEARHFLTPIGATSAGTTGTFNVTVSGFTWG